MSEQQMKLFKILWSIANKLRGNMDASEFKNYILGFIFYKFLSEKISNFGDNELIEDKIKFEDVEDIEIIEALNEEAVKQIGYFLEPKHLFFNLVKKASKGEFILDDLTKALKEVEQSTIGHDSEDDFIGLFGDVDLKSQKLGRSEEQKNKLISEIFLNLAEVDFQLEDSKIDVLGDAYEYLIGEFASSAGKKAGEFYTPQQVSKILAKIVTLDKSKIKTAYDPTCGSGSLLLRISKECKVSNFYGQELNQTTFNLARMNMILHGIKYSDFDIKQGDTLEDDRHKDEMFEAVVANPPFSAQWSQSSQFLSDDRFARYGKLAPKSKADFAFVQHMIYHLDENGTMAVVLPHGVLFRGAAEGVIRKYLIKERNYLDAVIGLPANIFYGTSIPTVVLVFKKCRVNSENVLFIDSSKDFEKRKNQNHITDENLEKIMKTYKNREVIDKYSYLAKMEEIAENDYNLNIPRYVDTFEEEEPVNIEAVAKEIKNLEGEIKEIDDEILKFCVELGIEAPIG